MASADSFKHYRLGRWFPCQGTPRAVVTVAHGLNNRAEAMDALIARLTAHGYQVLRLSLHAYAESPAHVDQWWCDVLRQGAAEARVRAPGLPLCHVSYSLGSLVAVEALREAPGAAPVGCVFLAPALALTALASFIRVLTALLPLCSTLRSRTPPGVRARDATPLSEYQAMLRLLARATAAIPAAAAATPTRILMSPADGAVSFRKIAGLVKAPALARWDLHPVYPQKGAADHHLLIAQDTVGLACWEDIVAKTLEHLDACLGG